MFISDGPARVRSSGVYVPVPGTRGLAARLADALVFAVLPQLMSAASR